MKRVRIPGKVMLSGEYAVLYGATAVLAPVPRYLEIAETSLPPQSSYSKVIDIALKHIIPEIAEFEKKSGVPHLHVDCHEFYYHGDNMKSIKLGLGCSAAEAVGVVALRYERAGRAYSDYTDEIFQHAVKIHNTAQSKLGSGADVAVCSYGKPLKFRILEDGYNISLIDPDQIKTQMPFYLVWTGQSADTRSMVKQFQRYIKSGDEKVKEYLANLIDASNKLAELWFDSSRQELFELIDIFNQAMQKCALQAGISYRLPIHDEIEKWALRHGGRAKPTGAGGGDMILLAGDLPVEQIKQMVIPLKFDSFF